MATPSSELKKGYKKLKRKELWGQLTNVINLRSAQDQVLWSIFGVFWAANAILLVALFPNGTLSNSFAGTVIGLVGLSFSMVWYSIQNRALGHLKRHESLMASLETKLKIDPKFAVSPELNQKSYDNYLEKGWKARDLMKVSSIGAIIFWSGVFLSYIFRIYIFFIIRMY